MINLNKAWNQIFKYSRTGRAKKELEETLVKQQSIIQAENSNKETIQVRVY
jgi:hypothetical protein